ncbi:hypothetical protein FOXG_20782 [Fusarium oxysporum f. sp. lycopersici 4287]|uniref:Secreted protein n=2 Tax=Fusarium oxysporum TaxID=5507 RepID=A0A0J9VQI6_FUSO4|nr:hypothetical protein FOXG_20782 [Fusarium oxysporum f. sp. lycopersici 4287]EXK38077.1 hypothetical protein FOMG_08572 [Fusarium oxysporum f. sp. melonis 26406]KNB13178.1 hypothetical protein FOXG_20782 [Fusarium oxysporum f. sp. lycopersici 4287]
MRMWFCQSLFVPYLMGLQYTDISEARPRHCYTVVPSRYHAAFDTITLRSVGNCTRNPEELVCGWVKCSIPQETCVAATNPHESTALSSVGIAEILQGFRVKVSSVRNGLS